MYIWVPSLDIINIHTIGVLLSKPGSYYAFLLGFVLCSKDRLANSMTIMIITIKYAVPKENIYFSSPVKINLLSVSLLLLLSLNRVHQMQYKMAVDKANKTSCSSNVTATLALCPDQWLLQKHHCSRNVVISL